MIDILLTSFIVFLVISILGVLVCILGDISIQEGVVGVIVIALLTSGGYFASRIILQTKSNTIQIKETPCDTAYVHDTIYILYEKQQEEISEESNWKK